MKICHVLCGLENGGIEAVLLNYLSRMDFSQDELHLITYNTAVPECEQKFRALGFQIHRIRPKREGFFKSNREMATLIQQNAFDVVHAHLSEWNCIPLYYALQSGVKQRIHHVHTLKTPNGLLNKCIFASLNALAIQLATDCVACSETVAAAWFGNRGLQRNDVLILRNGIDVGRYQPNIDIRNDVRAEWDMKNSLCVGFVGRLMEEKNPLFLLDVLERLRQKRADAVLVICGDGPQNQVLRDRIQARELAENVRLLGTRQDMERMYQGFDVLAMPSLYEGFPLTSVEAQVAGVPCCFSDSIAREVRMTPICSFLSLKAGPSVWADELISLAGRRSIEGDEARRVIAAGYSIDDQVAVLEQLYEKTRRP